jgi:vacuolar-type H+-ATPase subunit I/STV1
MFGDIGHGGVLLALAIWFVRDSSTKKLLPDVHSMRYLILLMGMFAFYSGWIYN